MFELFKNRNNYTLNKKEVLEIFLLSVPLYCDFNRGL